MQNSEKEQLGPIMPIGGIIIWSGDASHFDSNGIGMGQMIGWAICNGYNGTPDLRSRFIVGIDEVDYKHQSVGGQYPVKLKKENMPSHTHSVNDPGHSHGLFHGSIETGSPTGNWQIDINNPSKESYSQTGITLDTSGGDEAFDNRPPYYAVYFIMKIQ